MTELETCIVCHRAELGDDQTQTCTRCVARVRSQLIEIEQLWAMLPEAIADHAGAAKPIDQPRGTEDPLPGGDAMVLLGPGSTRWHSELIEIDSAPGVLERMDRDWRITMGLPVTDTPMTLSGWALFLLRNLARMAQDHPAFDEAARDIARLAAQLRTATREGYIIEHGVPCLDCGMRLTRRWGEPQPCKHNGSHSNECDQGGRDSWRCENRACPRTVYSDDDYHRAMWQHWLDVQSQREAG